MATAITLFPFFPHFSIGIGITDCGLGIDKVITAELLVQTQSWEWGVGPGEGIKFLMNSINFGG